MNHKYHILTILLIVSLVFFLTTPPLYSQEDFIPARVKDISDRAYEPAVIELLDGAKESIVMSMYSISVGRKGNNPVRFLLGDLLEARERGVSVTLYLNTKFNAGKKNTRIIEKPEIKQLQEAGCKIHLIAYHQRLHDKLIIVDGRYVVESSANWSISALRDNYESATLIDSENLAKIKRARVKSFILPESVPFKKPDKNLYTNNLPESISIPQALVTDRRFLPAMIHWRAANSMSLYLRLVAYSQHIGKRDFFLDMGSMGLSMGMPESRGNTELRHQVIRYLKHLNKRYKLINVKFFYNKDAWVELIEIPGDTFVIPLSIVLDEESSPTVKFYLMAQTLLELQGEDINAMSTRQVEKRLPISHSAVYNARKEIGEKRE